MPYTYRSLAGVLVAVSTLCALSASGAIAGWWLAVLIAVALVTPALMLRSPAEAAVIPREPTGVVKHAGVARRLPFGAGLVNRPAGSRNLD